MAPEKTTAESGATPRNVLDCLGIDAKSCRRLKSGYNVHWLVRTEHDLIVLRRYWARRTLKYVQYEMSLTQSLSTAGWPVPTPVAEPVEAGGFVWYAFTHLPGRSRIPRTEEAVRSEQRSRGRLLADFHRDMAPCSNLGQREGWVRADEVFVRSNDGPALDEVLTMLALRRPDEARLLSWHADWALTRMEELEAHKLPGVIVHGDFAPWNLRYRHGQLSGIFDFDLSHLNLRVADFALSWRGMHDEVIVGYNEVEPLDEVEWELITPVWWAWCLAGARDQLIREEDSDLNWVISHITRHSRLVPAPAFNG